MSDTVRCPMRTSELACKGVLEPKPAPPAPRFVCTHCRRVYAVHEVAWMKAQNERAAVRKETAS